MPNIDESHLLDALRDFPYPNGVSFRREESIQTGILFFCERCESIGYRWHFDVSLASLMEIHNFRFAVKDALVRHAEMHNSLCQKFEEVIKTRGHNLLILREKVEVVDPFSFRSDDINKTGDRAFRKRMLRPVED